MDTLVNFKAFAYRLASAALRVGVVLMIALPFVVLAARPWLNAEQVANESSGKRPGRITMMSWSLPATTPQFVVETGGTEIGNTGFGNDGVIVDCVELAVQNNAGVDVCLWFTSNEDACDSGGIDCEVAIRASQLWLLKDSSSFVTRMPAQTQAHASWRVCVEPRAVPADIENDLLYVSCLGK